MLTTMILVHPYTNMALLLTKAKENSDNKDNRSTKPIIKEKIALIPWKQCRWTKYGSMYILRKQSILKCNDSEIQMSKANHTPPADWIPKVQDGRGS